MKRGFTLVEQMITVALIGVSSVVIASISLQTERAALAELQRARAGVVLGYRARSETRGRPANPEVLARLTASLPQVKMERELEGDVVTLTTTWRAPQGGQARRVLTVLSGGKR